MEQSHAAFVGAAHGRAPGEPSQERGGTADAPAREQDPPRHSGQRQAGQRQVSGEARRGRARGGVLPGESAPAASCHPRASGSGVGGGRGGAEGGGGGGRRIESCCEKN